MKGGYSKKKSNGGSQKFNGGGGGGGGGGGFGSHKKKMKKNMRRLGGGGLSLEVFANAKSNNNQYNPAIIKKQREFYKNAKCVNKYKKTLKQHSQQNDFYWSKMPLEDQLHDAENIFPNTSDIVEKKTGGSGKNRVEEDADIVVKIGEGNEAGEDDAKETSQKNKKKRTGARSAQELYETKRDEKEKARMEREAQFQARKEERERSEARRKALREKMAKKTRSGQPVMKYRIERMLETLQEAASSSS